MTHTVETLGLDREAMFPNYHADVMAGRALIMPGSVIEAAQDRVAMRRLLRPVLPSVDLRRMGNEELSFLIDQLRGVHDE